MKNLKEIARLALEKYDEMNPIVISETNQRYAIPGVKGMSNTLETIKDRVYLMRSRSKNWTDFGGCVLPISIDENILVYMNVCIKTTSPRLSNERWSADSVMNKSGIVPCGMTVLKKNEDDNLYYIAQIDFYQMIKHDYSGSSGIRDLFDGLENINAGDVCNLVRGFSNYYFYQDIFYVKLDSRNKTDSFSLNDGKTENWHLFNSASRLQNVLWNKYLLTEYHSDNEGVIIGHTLKGDVFSYPAKYLHIGALVEENKVQKRIAKVANSKKGTVQDKINNYCKYVNENTDYNYKDNYSIIEKLEEYPSDCVVVRCFVKSWGKNIATEKYRFFIEKKSFTVAEKLNYLWTTTKASFDYVLNSASIPELEFEKFKNTKFEYIKTAYDSISKYKNLSLKDVLELLTINLFEIVYQDEFLKGLFEEKLAATFEKDKNDTNPSYYHNTCVTDILRFTFAPCIHDDIVSKKRLKQLSKKKWFKLSPSQMKKMVKLQEFVSENRELLYSLKRDQYNGFYSHVSKSKEIVNAFNLLDRFTQSAWHNQGYKYSINNISSLSEKDFDDFIELVKNFHLTVSNPFVYNNGIGMFLNNDPITKKNELLRLIKICDGDTRVIQDILSMINYINNMAGMNIPRIKKGLETITDIREWHDEIMEIQNQINFERDRYMSEAEKKRMEGYQLGFDKQQKVWKKFEATDGEHVIVIPKKPSELSAEGLALHHCVKSFAQKVAEGKTTILFIRKVDEPETPYFTMEVCGREIRQVHGACNCNVPAKSTLEEFIDGFAKKHNLSKASMNRVLG